MQVFESIDTSSFRYNGLKYAKNFMIIPQGATNLGIYNAFDTSFELIGTANFNEIQIDDVIYTSQSACINVLSPLIFYKPTGVPTRKIIVSTSLPTGIPADGDEWVSYTL